jgi:hypothetical protein
VITPRPIGATGFLGRLFGAAALNAGTYEEVEADPAATAQAVIVVVLSSVAAGFGARGFGGEGLAAIAFFSVVALMAWGAWSLVTYQIGVRILPDVDTQANLGELLRTIGFASGPGILRIFGVVPALTRTAFVISALWMLAAMVVAVRQALDYRSTARAVAVCSLGWFLAIGLALVFGLLFGPRLA